MKIKQKKIHSIKSHLSFQNYKKSLKALREIEIINKSA